MKLIHLIVAASALMAQPAGASSCVNAKTVPIVFAKGARCWTYNGDATHFVGAFSRGQKIVASSTGRGNYGDGSWSWQRTERRDVSVTAPGQRFIDIDDDEDSSFVAPVSGKYEFSFSPCAMWRDIGTFIVCAK